MKAMATAEREEQKPPEFSEKGFDDGLRGVHTSRTMMFSELEAVMDAVQAPRTANAVRDAIIEDNIIGKSTRSGRLNTARKVVDLYSFDAGAELFIAFEKLWGQTQHSHPVLAVLLAASRDSVLRSTADVICTSQIGEVVSKDSIYDALLNSFASKYAENTLRSTSRNVMASWKQSGHLAGRKLAVRTKAPADYVVATYAVLIGILRGLKGQEVLKSPWVRLLDMTPPELELALHEANRHGLLTYRRVGEVVELARGPSLLEEPT